MRLVLRTFSWFLCQIDFHQWLHHLYAFRIITWAEVFLSMWWISVLQFYVNYWPCTLIQMFLWYLKLAENICLINWLQWATESAWTEKGNSGAVIWWQLWQGIRRKESTELDGFHKDFQSVGVCAVGRHLSVNIDHYWPDSCFCGQSLLSLVHFIMQSLLLYQVLPLILLGSLCPSEILKANVWMNACQPACIRTWELVLFIVFPIRLTQSHSL